MKEYIEKAAALKALSKSGVTRNMRAHKIVAAIPAAEVVEVRHGRWIPSDYTGDCCYTCSECGFERDAYLLDVGNYCPNCGCCMLGGGEDDTVSDKQ